MNKPTILPHEMAAILRQDLSAFIRKSFETLNPQTKYLPNWHVDLIADKLMKVARGEITRLIINVPPRYLKSISASVAFVAFLLGKFPDKKIICASYNQGLANKHALDTRLIMQSDWYQEIFPNTKISADKNALHDFTTTQFGNRLAVSTGGGATGRGADLLVIDDPVRPDEALSDVERKNCNNWFDGTAYTRLNSKKNGAIIMIMQRLHLDDLVGHVLALGIGDWDVLSLPAIAEMDEVHEYQTIMGKQRIERKAGEALHPERESLETLADVRTTMGEYAFFSQYQQSPVPTDGGIIKDKWLYYYTPSDLPAKFDLIVQSWDTATKTHDAADYSVCVTLGVKDQTIYLLDVIRARMEFPDLKRRLIACHNQYQPNAILIEDASSGTSLQQEVQQDRIYCLKLVRPEGDKRMRLLAQSLLFENGRVRLPVDAPWLKDFTTELTSFPTTKHDDQVDALTQALAYVREYLDVPGFIQYIRACREEDARNGRFY